MLDEVNDTCVDRIRTFSCLVFMNLFTETDSSLRSANCLSCIDPNVLPHPWPFPKLSDTHKPSHHLTDRRQSYVIPGPSSICVIFNWQSLNAFFGLISAWSRPDLGITLNGPDCSDCSLSNLSRNVKKWIKYIKRGRFQEKSMSGTASEAKKIVISSFSSAVTPSFGSPLMLLDAKCWFSTSFFHLVIIGRSQKSSLLIGWELRALLSKSIYFVTKENPVLSGVSVLVLGLWWGP